MLTTHKLKATERREDDELTSSYIKVSNLVGYPNSAQLRRPSRDKAQLVHTDSNYRSSNDGQDETIEPDSYFSQSMSSKIR
ncbi:MAG: hypothetical protein P1U74_07045 [Legionellaceae bacterium]|nr:hypothetical protein [Legionellaceae bacterium]